MRNITRLVALLTMMLLGLLASGAPGAVAQGMDAATPPESEPSAFDDLSQLEGLQTVISRDFSVDYEAIYSTLATPSADGEVVEPELPQGIQYLGIALFQFDNGDHASAAYDQLITELTSQFAGHEDLYEDIEVDDMSDNTLAVKSTQGDETYGTTTTAMIVTQEDDYIYLVTGASLEEDPTDTVKDVISIVQDADAGDGDGEFHDDGTSQGGQWDKLPSADDDAIPDGMIVTDMQLYPEATPEAGS